MSLTTSTVTPLIVQSPKNQIDRHQIMIINPNETILNEPHTSYQSLRTIRRSYLLPSKSKYQYTIEQVNLTNYFFMNVSLFLLIGREIISLLSMVSILVYT
jgi:hypothetical protein